MLDGTTNDKQNSSFLTVIWYIIENVALEQLLNYLGVTELGILLLVVLCSREKKKVTCICINDAFFI